MNRLKNKTTLQTKIKEFIFLPACLLLVLLSSCSDNSVSGEEPQGVDEVGDFLANLTYDADELLNVQPNDAAREPVDTTATTEQDGITQRTCTSTTYTLQNNFEEVAILRPTQDVIWPGALVEANQSLLDGLPEPARFERSPVKIRIDLPGIGTNGTKTIESPDQANVQNAIDEALEWWNANAYEEGYVNAASSSNRITTSYASTQASLDLGLNVEWATGDVQSQFNFETSEESRVVMATFKQAFYTITYVQENGAQPEDVFGPSVSLQQVQSAFSSTAPPAYVSSITYGRIIMFRMETSSSYTSAEVETAFRYAAGGQVEGDLESTYKEILQNSSVEVITIGGNAAVASEAVTARSAGDLVPIITGDNAVYSRNNPGVPIAYAVKYLKDDKVAKLGYTTEYTATECSAIRTADVVTVDLIEFEAVNDCDVGPGDFDFNATVYYNDEQMFNTGGVGPWISAELDDGETKSIDEEVVFNAQRQDGNTFAVDFWAREQDNPPFGSPNYNDLNGKKKRTHTYNINTGWTNLDPGNGAPDKDGDGVQDLEIELVGEKSNTCRVKVYYDVTLQ
ncbi:thiol-activated cytolysin family protein [Rhodohalobacter barkolensis]|uniref:Thiol-activated cytolysin n=1 Tax=Rhodohalobacter barkolensis TaxID=2053187 RepID=A0A2N0VKI7_9BACT|nr:thiol-activated cytolysin family protein [Rhodohalobacter barkolensis]PKD44679.1 hypothetical protein CWD77_04235 [Rhodohalobacter barkolensis]